MCQLLLWRASMYSTDELKIKERQLIEAFVDPEFESTLKETRLTIEELLKGFISYLKTQLSSEQKIYENIESRIKSIESFQEKIYRKDYIKTWDVSDDKKFNQQTIATKLPDLLGFRINCFFWQDEKKIYSILKEYYDQGHLANVSLDFSENTKQQNGHSIYKLTGLYNDRYCFEIQIKSIMHNIWGEVEHKTIYKNRNYDVDASNKVAITEEIFNILQASDRQLVSLFKKNNDEKQLTYALFFEKTKNAVAAKSGTDILANHYNAYFQVFANLDNYKRIKQYVAYSLLDENFPKVDIDLTTPTEKVLSLKTQICSEFLEYNLKCLFYIFETIYNVSDYEQFLLFLSSYIIENYTFTEEMDDENDAFDDDDEVKVEDNKNEILTMLESKIGGRKKND